MQMVVWVPESGMGKGYIMQMAHRLRVVFEVKEYNPARALELKMIAHQMAEHWHA